ncbi:MAG: glutaminyl-peptide cyclotransferase, partial [Bacteroidales bacterium]|nr:glutaminyl-peptide cyclotransferase [Bacteroidales bacterium]
MKPLLNVLLFSVFILINCSHNNEHITEKTEYNKAQNKVGQVEITILTPGTIRVNDSLKFAFSAPGGLALYDSITCKVNADQFLLKDSLVLLSTRNFAVGNYFVHVYAYKAGALSATGSYGFRLLSDIDPRYAEYQIINKFPHHTGAFTQGLIYKNGKLIEGTGQYNEI